MDSQRGVKIKQLLKSLGQRAMIAVPILMGGCVLLVIAYGVHQVIQVSPAFVKGSGISGWMKVYSHTLESIQNKVDRLQAAQTENAHLKIQNARLSVQIQTEQFKCALATASEVTRIRSKGLLQATGSNVGRTLASLSYQVPPGFTPIQLYTLGVDAVREGNFEKIAAIFSELTTEGEGLTDPGTRDSRKLGAKASDRSPGSSADRACQEVTDSAEDGDEDHSFSKSYKTARNFLIAGMAWYHLDNYQMASEFFDRALATPEVPENLPYQAQAKLWKALTFKVLSNSKASQGWLKKLIDDHPRSQEVGWINGRKPATHHEVQSGHQGEKNRAAKKGGRHSHRGGHERSHVHHSPIVPSAHPLSSMGSVSPTLMQKHSEIEDLVTTGHLRLPTPGAQSHLKTTHPSSLGSDPSSDSSSDSSSDQNEGNHELNPKSGAQAGSEALSVSQGHGHATVQGHHE